MWKGSCSIPRWEIVEESCSDKQGLPEGCLNNWQWAQLLDCSADKNCLTPPCYWSNTVCQEKLRALIWKLKSSGASLGKLHTLANHLLGMAQEFTAAPVSAADNTMSLPAHITGSRADTTDVFCQLRDSQGWQFPSPFQCSFISLESSLLKHMFCCSIHQEYGEQTVLFLHISWFAFAHPSQALYAS